MIVCFACYGDRLASLLDTASELLLYKVVGIGEDGEGSAEPAGRVGMPEDGPLGLPRALRACGVDVLVCGGISSPGLSLLRQTGIEILPWISGPIETVVRAYLAGRLDELVMPGCRRGCRQGCRPDLRPDLRPGCGPGCGPDCQPGRRRTSHARPEGRPGPRGANRKGS